MGFESPRRDLGRPTLTFNVAFVFTHSIRNKTCSHLIIESSTITHFLAILSPNLSAVSTHETDWVG
jgi:hypothetical protein